MPDLYDASRFVFERKQAILAGQHGAAYFSDVESIDLVATGTGLDGDDLHAIGASAGDTFGVVAEEIGLNPRDAIAGAWVDGAITGAVLALMLAGQIEPPEPPDA